MCVCGQQKKTHEIETNLGTCTLNLVSRTQLTNQYERLFLSHTICATAGFAPAPVATSPTAPAPVAAPTAVETVEAGEATTVTVSANAFDMRTDDDVGCAPDGCTAENTRDGGLDDVSRWSCSSELVAERGGAAGEECQIVYEFYEAQVVRSVAIAFLKGDARTRTVNVNVNGVIHTMIESGGITSDLETFELIDTQGVLSIGLESIGLAADEFLSIIEVCMCA